MTKSNFQIVFNMDVSHSYFKNNNCNCLSYSFGEVTQRLAIRFGLRIRKRVSGFGFYINSRSTLNSFLEYLGAISGKTYFDFSISATNPDFYFFTESPIGCFTKFIYDSNSSLNITTNNKVQLMGAHSPAANMPCIGLLRVYFNDIIKNGPMQFAINYEARATQWQYFIINNSSVPLQNPSISGKTNINFTGPELVTIETGQKAMLFTSGERLLPLAEVSENRFNLVNTPTSISGQPALPAQVVFKGLPNPDPVRINTVISREVTTIISPMYVYI